MRRVRHREIRGVMRGVAQPMGVGQAVFSQRGPESVGGEGWGNLGCAITQSLTVVGGDEAVTLGHVEPAARE